MYIISSAYMYYETFVKFNGQNREHGRVIIMVGEVLLQTTWQQDTCISELQLLFLNSLDPVLCDITVARQHFLDPDCRHEYVGVSSRNPSYLDGPMPFDVPLAH